MEWNNTYGGSKQDLFQSVIQTSDDGYLAAGQIISASAGSYDGWLIKLTSTGDIEWNKTYGGSYADAFNSVVQTSDGGYIAAGYIRSAGAGFDDGWLIKLTSTGDIEWNKTYGGAGYDNFQSVVQTSDGGYIASGSMNSNGAGAYDGWLMKLTSTGDIEWNITYGGGYPDMFLSVVQTLDGGYITAGQTNSSGTVDYNGWLIKLTSTGDIEWNKTYGGESSDMFYSIVQTSDGGFIAAGLTTPAGADNTDGWLLKLTSTGDIEWNKNYGGPGVDFFHSVVQSNHGGYIAAGRTKTVGQEDVDGWIVNIDSNGGIEWDNIFGGSGHDIFYSAIQTSEGDNLAAGYTYSAGAGINDGWLLKQSVPVPTTTIVTTTEPTTTVSTTSLSRTTTTAATPASGLLIAILCGLFIVIMFRARKSK